MDAVNQPLHGGDLQRAVALYGGDLTDWIDCSSGIAPWAYPLPAVPDDVWQRLPDQDDALLKAAQNYYGCDQLLPLAGSQVAIALLPKLRAPCRIAIISPAYAEHHWQWQQAGHQVSAISSEQVDKCLENSSIDVLIVVNPNNPSGEQISATTLLAWHASLAKRGGWLVVDEAFADCCPENTLLPQAGLSGLIILRSIGKFFGLAGIRLGFIACEKPLLAEIKQALGPWHISGPAQWAGQIALSDKAWQAAQQQRLLANQEWMIAILSEAGLAPSGSLPLLHWCPTPNAKALHSQLAKHKIWCRLFQQNNHQGLRFGPVAEHQQALFKTRLWAALSNPTMVL
ncbi:threonine-phosphate decarboxylase CobD [Iodobacter sp. CM08]|uniref:threonine-phosphate decarboxylase CobD n=1 Tax=Iodobacter sp. CM08 TaxID=3085902 RepID=UPI00298184A5|nr:threonine-phosphate decarboxylase CobD [Iodobacter sp. CM08]MDW5415496.1 threonine-phosphate decarboxylase CobD [Iodobacter sp. CM08]